MRSDELKVAFDGIAVLIALPVAGLALASRPTYWKSRPVSSRRRGATVTADVWPGIQQSGGVGSVPSGAPKVATGSAPTVRFGANLHVVVVTVANLRGALPSLRVDDVRVVEGAGGVSAVFEVQLSRPVAAVVQFPWAKRSSSLTQAKRFDSSDWSSPRMLTANTAPGSSSMG